MSYTIGSREQTYSFFSRGEDRCGAGAMVGGAAALTDERSDVGSNCAVAASAGDSVVVSGELTGGLGGMLTSL